MGKTKRNSNYNNFVDTDKNNLIVVKPRKIVEKVRTFEGEEGFVVPKNNTYLDKGLIVNINDHDESAIDVVGVSDSVYENAGGSVNITANVTASANGIYVQLSGGQQPYQSVSYQFGSSTGTQQGNPNQSNFGVNANFDSTNNCYQGGSYTLHCTIVDANGDNGSASWSGVIQGTCATPSGGGANPSTPNVQSNVGTPTATATPSSTPTPTQATSSNPITTATPITTGSATANAPTQLSAISVTATLSNVNNIQVNTTISGGTPPFNMTYVIYKNGTAINTINQVASGNTDTYSVSNLADGNYSFLVTAIDSVTNTSIGGMSNLVNVTNPSQSGTPSTGQTGMTTPTSSTPSTGQTGQTGGATTTPTTTTSTTTPTPTTTTSGSTTILGGGVIERPIFLERETIIEAETFYSKNKLPIWLLIAIGVYFIATNKNK